MKPTDIDKQDALEEQARSFKDDEVPAGAQYEFTAKLADNERKIKEIKKEVKTKYAELVVAYKELCVQFKDNVAKKKAIKDILIMLSKEHDLVKIKALTIDLLK